MIKTNRMCIEFNKENIQRDFDIYVISKNSEKGKKENFFGKNVLDLPQQKFKAQSVVYTYGNTWYVIETECDGNEPLTDKVKRLIFSDKGVIC